MRLVKNLGFALAACLLAGASPLGAQPFRIIVTSTEVPLVPNSVLHLAEREGYFAREGVEVELIAVEQTPMAVTALRTGAGEMANIGLETLLGLHAGGDHSLKAVGSTDKSIPYIIAARKGLSLADLSQGARFGVGRPNSLDHTMSLLVLRDHGVQTSAVTWVPLGQPQVRAQALVQGRVDASTLSIGMFLSIPDRDDLQILIDGADFYEAAPILTKVNAVPASVLASRGAEVEAVLTALTRAARDFAADPARWPEAMARARPDIAPQDLEVLAGHYADAWTVNGGLQAEEAEYARTWLYQTDRFQGEPLVDIRLWADFSPADAMLQKLGLAERGDPVSR